MISSCLDIIIEICQTYGTSEHVLLANVLKDSMLSADSKILIGDSKIQYLKGIASGLRWTALLDTIINIAEFEIVREIVEERLHRPINITCMNFQGDDVQSALKEKEFIATMILETYKELNFNVNAAKTMIVRDRDEFLRLVYDNGCIVGYPARAIVSKKPMATEPLTKIDRINGIINNHIKLINRGADTNKIAKYLLHTLKHWFKDESNEDIINYIITPSSLGGYGLAHKDPLAKILYCRKKQNYYQTSLSPTIIKIKNKPTQGSWLGEFSNYNVKISQHYLEQEIMKVLPQSAKEIEIVEKAQLTR